MARVVAGRLVLDPEGGGAPAAAVGQAHVALDGAIRLRVQTQPPSPFGQTHSAHLPSPTSSSARASLASIQVTTPASLGADRPLRALGGQAPDVAAAERGPLAGALDHLAAGAIETAQKVWPAGPTWARAAQSMNSSQKTPM